MAFRPLRLQARLTGLAPHSTTDPRARRNGPTTYYYTTHRPDATAALHFDQTPLARRDGHLTLQTSDLSNNGTLDVQGGPVDEARMSGCGLLRHAPLQVIAMAYLLC